MWGITTPDEAKKVIDSQSSIVSEIRSLEDQAIKLVGTDIYHKLIKGYTEKQWGKPATQLPKEIITRLPVRFTYDSNYFNDIYQGIPSNGYTTLFKKLLQGIEVRTSCDYFENKENWDSTSRLILYTGPIDRFFDYVFDPLEYKSQRFEHFHLTYTSNFQGTPVVNYTDSEVQYTRVIEHKHFQSRLSLNTPTTWITYEYPQLYNPDTTDPMYPVNDEVNTLKLKKYLELAEHQKNIIFRPVSQSSSLIQAMLSAKQIEFTWQSTDSSNKRVIFGLNNFSNTLETFNLTCQR
jgi:UDP-galactopyranose mutase